MTRLRGSLAVIGLLACLPAGAQDAADELSAAAESSQATRRATQEELDDWAAERAALKQRWDVARAQVDYLEERVALERERLLSLEAAGDELERRLAESRRLESSLEDTLLGVLGRLDRAVARDLPFLPEERAVRLATVRRELGDAAATPADKLRRVLEALLIETRYGGALELNQDRITVDGAEFTCDLLHVGRLGLYWLTPDEKRGGMWDPAAARFVELTGDELESVRRAVQMAARRRAVGVQTLPLGRVGS
jgi:hypothetical protein